MWPSLAFEVTFGKFYCSRVKSISVPTIFVMVKIFNAQYLDQNIGVRLSGAGCGLLGIVCIKSWGNMCDSAACGYINDEKNPKDPD